MSAAKRGLPERRRMRHDRHFVDELTQRMGEGIGRMMPIDTISSNQDQPRATSGDLADLVSSIGKHGILEPLLVRRQAPRANGYELVSGERRFHAALEAGLREVPCIELRRPRRPGPRDRLDREPPAQGPHRVRRGRWLSHPDRQVRATPTSRSQRRSGGHASPSPRPLALLDIPEEIRGLCRHADISAKGMLLEIARPDTRDDAGAGPRDRRGRARS